MALPEAVVKTAKGKGFPASLATSDRECVPPLPGRGRPGYVAAGGRLTASPWKGALKTASSNGRSGSRVSSWWFDEDG